MIDHTLHEAVDQFIESGTRNSWLTGDYLRVYLRRNRRFFGATLPASVEEWRTKLMDNLDLANIGDMRSEEQLRGIFPAFLDHLESYGLPIYVENIEPPALRWYFTRRGYIRRGDIADFCAYRLPD